MFSLFLFKIETKRVEIRTRAGIRIVIKLKDPPAGVQFAPRIKAKRLVSEMKLSPRPMNW